MKGEFTQKGKEAMERFKMESASVVPEDAACTATGVTVFGTDMGAARAQTLSAAATAAESHFFFIQFLLF